MGFLVTLPGEKTNVDQLGFCRYNKGMETKTAKRGRPTKSEERKKAEYLDIRLEASEKQSFKDAADLAGLDLSSWVRERLRVVARHELESAGMAVAFRMAGSGRRDELLKAEFVRPLTIKLEFADGMHYSLAVKRLGMPRSRIRWSSVTASETGDTMIVFGIKGDTIPIDASTLRYLVDAKYAAEIDSALERLQLSRDELTELARVSPPPHEWYAQPERDLTRKSWKQ